MRHVCRSSDGAIGKQSGERAGLEICIWLRFPLLRSRVFCLDDFFYIFSVGFVGI